MKRTVINRFKNYCFSIRLVWREVLERSLSRAGTRAGEANERTQGVEERNEAIPSSGGRENDGFSRLKLLCRSLRAGRLPDHLLSSTRKLPDANRFVSGRFKRFTIIHTNPNSINASSPPSPTLLHFVPVDRQRKSCSPSFVSFMHGPGPAVHDQIYRYTRVSNPWPPGTFAFSRSSTDSIVSREPLRLQENSAQ